MYSISGGVVDSMVIRQFTISVASLLMIFILSKIDIKFIFYHAYNIYFLILATLIMTEFLGYTGMGAKRWISLGIINIQPSEFMKIGVILALSRYFHNCHINEIIKLKFLLFPAFLVLLPTILILKQPNLGTSIVMISTATAIFFLAGVRLRIFVYLGIVTLLSMPVVWRFLYDYQKTRILIFLDPQRDTLGAGYNIIQSVISIGSGGVFGKGFLKGSQNQLDFLPENHTDFIFGLVAEEGGFLLCFILLFIYSTIIFILYLMSIGCSAQFYRLLILGFASLLFFHIFINIGMISGLLPVVGVPLPFLSYGGSNFLAMMIGIGLIFNAHFNQGAVLPKV
jgi:rod shape determining protein RodA